MRPVFVSCLEHALDQETAHAAAIDEQVAAERFTSIGVYRGDEARLGMLIDGGDHAFTTPHTLGLASNAQIAGVQACIEVIGITHGRQQGARVGGGKLKLASACRDGVQGIILEVVVEPGEAGFQPSMLKRYTVAGEAIAPEGMQISRPRARPTHEFDTELETRLGLAHELSFVETHDLVEPMNGGDGGLPHPDDADVIGFDQFDRALPRTDRVSQSRRRHPSGGAAANDDDAPNSIIVHGESIARIRAPLCDPAPRATPATRSSHRPAPAPARPSLSLPPPSGLHAVRRPQNLYVSVAVALVPAMPRA